MCAQDLLSGVLTVLWRERLAVGDISTDRLDERILLCPIKEDCGDMGLTAEGRGDQPMHPVDDGHRGTVNDDRGQLVGRFRQQASVPVVLAREPR
jgi:hypothetical protein